MLLVIEALRYAIQPAPLPLCSRELTHTSSHTSFLILFCAGDAWDAMRVPALPSCTRQLQLVRVPDLSTADCSD